MLSTLANLCGLLELLASLRFLLLLTFMEMESFTNASEPSTHGSLLLLISEPFSLDFAI